MWGDKLLSPRPELGRTTTTKGGEGNPIIEQFRYIYIYIHSSCARCPHFLLLASEHPKMGHYQWAYLSGAPPVAVPRDAQLASRLPPLPTSKCFRDEQHQFLSQLWLQAELLSILAPGAQARLESQHSRPPTPNSTSALAARRIAAAASWLLLAKLDHSLDSPVESWEHHLQVNMEQRCLLLWYYV